MFSVFMCGHVVEHSICQRGTGDETGVSRVTISTISLLVLFCGDAGHLITTSDGQSIKDLRLEGLEGF